MGLGVCHVTNALCSMLEANISTFFGHLTVMGIIVSYDRWLCQRETMNDGSVS
jgi:hypothetical protein